MSSRERDRDVQGRARNARPRDAYGRPLPRGAVGVERVPDDLSLTAEETLREAQHLIDTGQPFHAHEVLEARWKSGPDDERELWQGLAQVAVGLTHLQRSNARGAAALLRRGADRVTVYAAASPYGIDADGVVRHARELAARVESEGLTAVPEADLRPSLTVER
ncbi:MAG: DUF309 domain-containing protein [Streptosporangiales bacterium]|nr:DUF309 domain-containing protein [Streptosporangiales bacterium]